MRVLESFGNSLRYAHRFFDGKLLFLREEVAERSGLDVRHDVIGIAACFSRVVQRENVMELESCCVTKFLEELLYANAAHGLRRNDLQRNHTVVLHVPGQVDRAHPPMADLAVDEILVR